MLRAPPLIIVTFGRVISVSASATPVAEPMIDFFGHACGPLRFATAAAHFADLPPLYRPPRAIRMSKAVMMGGSTPSSLDHLIVPLSVTPCGFLGVPARFGVTFESTVTDVCGAWATVGETITAPNTRTPTIGPTTFRMISLLSLLDCLQRQHASEAERFMQTPPFLSNTSGFPGLRPQPQRIHDRTPTGALSRKSKSPRTGAWPPGGHDQASMKPRRRPRTRRVAPTVDTNSLT